MEDCADKCNGDKDRNHKIQEQRDDSFVCPVCGKLISGKYLPDVQGYIVERLYSAGGFRVISRTGTPYFCSTPI